jgi:hypothetical protein
MLIRRQSYHGDYACTLGRVAMSGGDGTDSYTRVPIARHAWDLWPCPIMLGNKCHHFLRPHDLLNPIRGWSDWMPMPIPGWGGRRAEQIGSKILAAHVYRNEEKWLCGLFLSLVLFKLVAPPPHPGVVGPYPVRGVWFPGHLLLEGTGHI